MLYRFPLGAALRAVDVGTLTNFLCCIVEALYGKVCGGVGEISRLRRLLPKQILLANVLRVRVDGSCTTTALEKPRTILIAAPTPARVARWHRIGGVSPGRERRAREAVAGTARDVHASMQP